jgi:hypothetical protein
MVPVRVVWWVQRACRAAGWRAGTRHPVIELAARTRLVGRWRSPQLPSCAPTGPDWKARIAGWIPPDIAEQISWGLFGLITGLPAEMAQIPWDGPQVRIVEHQAHAPGHAALLIEERGVLVAGDMLSDVLIPMHGNSSSSADSTSPSRPGTPSDRGRAPGRSAVPLDGNGTSLPQAAGPRGPRGQGAQGSGRGERRPVRMVPNQVTRQRPGRFTAFRQNGRW